MQCLGEWHRAQVVVAVGDEVRGAGMEQWPEHENRIGQGIAGYVRISYLVQTAWRLGEIGGFEAEHAQQAARWLDQGAACPVPTRSRLTVCPRSSDARSAFGIWALRVGEMSR